MKRTTIALIMLSLCCTGAFAKPDTKKTKMISAAKGYVKDNLKDPDSAKFKNEVVSGSVVCGEVNSKNSYGGYVGFKRFIAHDDGRVDFDSAEMNLAFDGWWTGNCFLPAKE